MKKEIEKGVWIVYDLEANRKIQELLTKNKFVFRFDPSLKITPRKEDEKFDNPALGVCKECNDGANERHKQYLEWKKDHPRRRRRRYWY